MTATLTPTTDPAIGAVVDDYLALVDDSMVAILPHALRIAVELGVAEVLPPDTHVPVPALALSVGADPDALRRLLSALATAGFFAADGADGFALTPLGARLRRDSADSLAASLLNTESQVAWLRATDCFRTGAPAFNRGHGDFFGDKDVNQAANAAFLRRMRERTCRLYRQAAREVDWSGSEVIMDIGGAQGYFLGRVLRAAPDARGVLFDRPQVIAAVAGTGGLLGRAADRCAFVAGDFFTELPPGADTHLLCSVLHDWTDEQTVSILRQSRKALAPCGRLLIVEMLVPAVSAAHPSHWSDLGMMVLTGGRERTRAEFEQLLALAGYQLRGVRPVTGSAFSVLEAE